MIGATHLVTVSILATALPCKIELPLTHLDEEFAMKIGSLYFIHVALSVLLMHFGDNQLLFTNEKTKDLL